MTLRIPASSKERIYIPITDSPAGVDLSILTWEIAVTAQGADPADGDYKAATWDATEGMPGILIGPGTTTVLQPDSLYTAWARTNQGGEQPVMYSGAVRTL